MGINTKGLLRKILSLKISSKQAKTRSVSKFSSKVPQTKLKLSTDPRGADPNGFERTVPDCKEC